LLLCSMKDIALKFLFLVIFCSCFWVMLTPPTTSWEVFLFLCFSKRWWSVDIFH
jgi:hypothetical protein